MTSVLFLRRAIDGGVGVVELHEAYLRLALAMPLAGQDPYPVLQEAAQRYPTSAHVQGGIAMRELESGQAHARTRGAQRLSQALELAQAQGESAALGTNLSAFCHNLGFAYEAAGATERALVVYRRAAELNPQPAGSFRRLAEAYRKRSDELTDLGQSDAARAAEVSVRTYDSR